MNYASEFVIAAPAKVNLTLAVLGRRPDGFHEIESWVIPIDWLDKLHFSDADAQFELTLSGWVDYTPQDETNLVCRAATALARAFDRPRTGRIRLHKDLPSGAGFGGGSSDAAAALRGLSRLWKLDCAAPRLAEIAASIGSDVPLFLLDGPAVIRGRGELVVPLQNGWGGWLVVVAPGFSCETPRVYQRWTQTQCSTTGQRPWLAVEPTARTLSERLFNDLEAAAFLVEPRLAALHRQLDGLHGRRIHMTGSGSGLFVLTDTRQEAEAWQAEAEPLLPAGSRVRIVRMHKANASDGSDRAT